MLEHPSIWQYSFVSHLLLIVTMSSDNLTSADNQQVGWLYVAYLNDHNEGPVE